MSSGFALLSRLGTHGLLIAALLSVTGAVLGPVLHFRAVHSELALGQQDEGGGPAQAPSHREQGCALCHAHSGAALPARVAPLLEAPVHRSTPHPHAPEAVRSAPALRPPARGPPVV